MTFVVVFLSVIVAAAANTKPPTSHCARACPKIYAPVCGSNAHTYSNECQLQVAACYYHLSHRILREVHKGSCGHHFTRPTTTVNPLGRNCDGLCNDEQLPKGEVCGSDGITYQTQCDFLRARCNATKYHHYLSLVHSGPCQTKNSPCSDFLTQRCPYNRHYLCANNGYTYINDCYLRQAECRNHGTINGTHLTVIHEGRCNATSTGQSHEIDCEQFVQPTTTIPGLAIEPVTTRSPITCPHTRNYVCSTHGVTYYNECYLCRSEMIIHHINLQSITNMTMPVAYNGYCHHSPVVG